MLISLSLFSTLQNVVILICVLWDGYRLFLLGCEISLNMYYLLFGFVWVLFWFFWGFLLLLLFFSEDLLHQSTGATEIFVFGVYL